VGTGRRFVEDEIGLSFLAAARRAGFSYQYTNNSALRAAAKKEENSARKKTASCEAVSSFHLSDK
jgi:hypothetical protein